VEDLAGDDDVYAALPLGRVFVLRLAPGERAQRAYLLTARARGPLRFAGFRVSTRFPFGLFAKSMLIEAPGETLVYPAVDPVRPAELGGAARSVGDARSRSQGRGTEAAGLRAFLPGDSARSVHWRASARRSALLVRDREREEKRELEVLLRTRGRAPGAEFEADVRRAASEVVAHLEAGVLVGLATDAERIEPGDGRAHRARMLSLLARVAPAGAREPAAPAAAGGTPARPDRRDPRAAPRARGDSAQSPERSDSPTGPRRRGDAPAPPERTA
jgi:uncharacterized protein (DUF58 family)